MERVVTVLVADDDEGVCEVLTRVCEELGLATRTAVDGRETLERLTETPADILLLDLSMPRLDGFEVLEKLKELAFKPWPAVIVVTAMTDIEGKARATDLGAIDWVVKPFRLPALKRRLQRAAAMIALEQRLQIAEERLESLRSHDSVTGVGAPGRLFAVLDAEFHAARVGERALSCIVVSDEHYGDTLDCDGRDAGEARLQTLASLIDAPLRSGDLVFRIDAAEFVVLLPGTPASGANRVIEKIRDAISEDDQISTLDLAFAAAEYPHPEINQASLLYRAVNLALAQARARSGGRVAFFEGF